MSGCGRNNREAYRRELANLSFNDNGCEDTRLKIPGCVCSITYNSVSEIFGPVRSSESIEEEVFPLKFNQRNYFRMFTRRTSPDNGKNVIRYINLVKADPSLNYTIRDDSPNITDNFRPLKYYIEIWHKDVNGALVLEDRNKTVHDKRTIIRYPNNSKAPLLRRELKELERDPLMIPRDVGAEFFIKILAIGAPKNPRRIKVNFKLIVECRGYYPYAVETDTQLDTRIGSGEVKVLANGKI